MTSKKVRFMCCDVCSRDVRGIKCRALDQHLISADDVRLPPLYAGCKCWVEHPSDPEVEVHKWHEA